ncbi:hypothetical protein C1752_03268 [Acaryochloris thomasi RCC1774]|uniref:Uncharacterized protein n=1 Tax=Acaryochloris thomasi RCC1774 TaxID=1764569 RepID=A0A2W1JH56_9CYAN|nr:hypothetical protein C1752_03268 [Acaryochloris thomasi RCC1774]
MQRHAPGWLTVHPTLNIWRSLHDLSLMLRKVDTPLA